MQVSINTDKVFQPVFQAPSEHQSSHLWTKCRPHLFSEAVSSHQSFRMSSQWHLQIPGAGSSWLRTTPAGWNYPTLFNISQFKHVSEHSVKTSPHSCFITLWSIHIFHQFSTATAATATSILSASVATLLTDVFHVDHVTGKRPRFCLCASRSDGNSHLCEIGWNDYFCVYQITPDHTHS